jgi:hypothetical protein
MPNIAIVQNSDIMETVMLRNGGLLIYDDKVFMVSSPTTGDHKLCSIIDLSSGSRVCTEIVTRNTNKKRILDHLRHKKCFEVAKLVYVKPTDYKLQVILGSNLSEEVDE